MKVNIFNKELINLVTKRVLAVARKDNFQNIACDTVTSQVIKETSADSFSYIVFFHFAFLIVNIKRNSVSKLHLKETRLFEFYT